VIGGEGGTILRLNLEPTLSVEQEIEGFPTSVELSQNYPNPFNPSTTITYRLPQTSHVTIKIFDLLGREMETTVDAVQQAGEHSIAWAPRTASSGIYFYQLQTAQTTITKKLLLLR
jgi:hypothetical protein